MRRGRAAIGSLVFFVLAPGVVVGLIPWLITGWELRTPVPYWAPLRVLGGLLIAAGLAVLVQAFVRFVVEGFGTPAPLAPPSKLVVGGFYRYVRNPMYVACIVAIIGQALLFGAPWLVAYAALTWVFPAVFVKWYEEPTLARQFGAGYETYRRNVPAWIPRLRPWHP